MVRIPLSTLGGAHINAVQSGAGQPVVALHGFTGDTTTWELLAVPIVQKCTLVAIDLLGHGDSDAPKSPDHYAFDRFIDGLEELLDHLGLHRVCWLGYSLGGRVALGVALSLPHRTSGLILESGSPGLATVEDRTARVESDEQLADWLEQVGIETFVDYWENLPLWTSQVRLPEPIRNNLRNQRLANRRVGLANSLRGMGTGAQPALHQRMHDLSVPVLILAGQEDSKFAAIAREMHEAIPRSCLSIVEHAGHAVHLEQPEHFNQVVMKFLSNDVQTALNGHGKNRVNSQQSL